MPKLGLCFKVQFFPLKAELALSLKSGYKITHASGINSTQVVTSPTTTASVTSTLRNRAQALLGRS